ncbi:MAG: HNH endonuclease [bacterium]|nr:HNH endonuclease [bacterium]
MTESPRLSPRRVVAERAAWCCEYCRSQARFCPDPFVVEHVVPRSGGGSDELSNLAFACQGCNGHKYTSVEATDPLDGGVVALFHPRRDDWAEHFTWSLDCLRVVGVTPRGRATVEKLRLNRVELINLRRVLRAQREHPP